MLELIPLLLFACVCLALMVGYPVALTLGGVSLLFAGFGIITGHFDAGLFGTLPNRLFGTVTNATLIAVPLFIFMGVMLERARIAEQLLDNMAALFARFPGGLGISVILVGTLLAASTGIVGATVVTLGLLALPSMLRRGYDPALATGSICATGTLGQIIPPSIVLVLLGDTLSTAYQQAQLRSGIFNPKTLSVGDLFIGALVPGVILVGMYLAYMLYVAWRRPAAVPRVDMAPPAVGPLLRSLLPPILLMVAVLGSIMAGAATPTEAAAVGAAGATLLALWRRQLNLSRLQDVCSSTLRITCMVFLILIGAAVFTLVFRGFGGEELVEGWFHAMPGGALTAVAIVMVAIFLLGFILDFIEIIFVVVPIVAPILLAMGVDPVWLGVMIAVNLQTSFLTPPFGFALFYLRGVTPSHVATGDIYRGVVPYIGLLLLLLGIMALWPGLVTALPALIRG